MIIDDKYVYLVLALAFLGVVALLVYAGENGTAATAAHSICPHGYVEVPVTGYGNGGFIYATTCAPAVKP